MPQVLCFCLNLDLIFWPLSPPPFRLQPRLSQRIIWCEYGNSPYWESEYIEWNFCIFIFSPPVGMMRVVLCFCFMFYLSRSRVFVLLFPPLGFYRLESYCVNEALYIVAASYCHIYIKYYKYTNWIQAKEKEKKEKKKSVDLMQFTVERWNTDSLQP